MMDDALTKDGIKYMIARLLKMPVKRQRRAEQIKAICLQQADAWHTMKCWIF